MDTQEKSSEEIRQEEIQKIVDRARASNPNLQLVLIEIPDDDEIYVAYLTGWGEYKNLIGSIEGEAEANEVIVQKYLVHPKVDYEKLQLEWAPGLVVGLAMKIQEALGFNKKEVTLKKL